MKNIISILSASVAAIVITTGCATAPQERGELCNSCGEVLQVSESDTTFESLTDEALITGVQNTSSAIASFDHLSQSGLPNRDSSLTQGPGMRLKRAEKSYDVLVRMNTGETRVVQLPRSLAGRWTQGDKVKVVGNSLIRN